MVVGQPPLLDSTPVELEAVVRVFTERFCLAMPREKLDFQHLALSDAGPTGVRGLAGAQVHVVGYVGRLGWEVGLLCEFLILHEISMLRLDERAETASILRVMWRTKRASWTGQLVADLGTR